MNLFESHILEILQKNISCDFLDFFFVTLSFIGDHGIIWIIMSFVLLLIPKTRKCGICIAFSLLLCLVFGNIILKPHIARMRPFYVNDALNIIIRKPRDYSFPSGHTFSSFAAAVSIKKYYKKWGYAALIYAFFTALSRVYLCVHYPTDLLGGAILGASLAIISYNTCNKLFWERKQNEI